MNDDLISRQGLMNTLHIKEDCQDCEYSNGNFCNLSPDFVNACEAICDAPSAERRGKWIHLDSMDERHDELRCPFCHKDFTVDAYRMCDIGFTAEDLKHCPNCGCDMRGEP